MKIKQLICVLLTLAFCAAVFAACSKEPADNTDATTAAGETEETTAAEAADETTEAAEASDETTEAAADDAAADAADAADDAVVEIAEEDRTPAKLAGTFASDRCSIVAEAIDDSNMKFSVKWSSSATETTEWEMTGTLDPDTIRVNYSDCVCKTVVYADDGTGTETVKYENGVGRIQFLDLDSLIWQDEQENVAAAMTFTRNP